jgi:hypothetical protein
MSKVDRNGTDDSANRQLDYIENLTGRDMTSVNDRDYSERVLEDEAMRESDEKEDWTKNQSPLTGRMSGTMEELERAQSSENIASDEVQQCLKDSLDCYQNCNETTLRCLAVAANTLNVTESTY